ncbi:MAG: LacI family transcriptional regulator [Clostridiaceae bacterium]|jgi:LacI family transcriptional regulator|nr:LacI family transcriptional regulator [Clostridiaceae bacterium]
MGKNKISIKDIATKAGVSVATVSRVINNKGKYSEETRERVLKIIEEYDYTPDMTAKALRIKRQQAIGVILPEVTNELFATITLEIQEQLFDLGYTTMIFNTSYRTEYAQRYSEMLKAQNVSGVICVYDRQTDIANYPEQIPLVYIGYDPKIKMRRENFAEVYVDLAHASWMVTNTLITKGCRKILYMSNWLKKEEGVSERFIGFKRAMEENDLNIDKRLLVDVDSTGSNSAYQAITMLIESGIEFDGVACNSDQAAAGAIFALNAHNLRVPEDVKVIGFDNMSISRHFMPSISSIEMRPELQSKYAVECMMAMINGNTLDKTKHIVPPEIILREST